VRLLRAGRHDERDHRRPVQPIEFDPRRAGEPFQERPDVHRVATRGVRQQATLEHQEPLVAREQLLHGIVQYLWFGIGDEPEPAEVAQHRVRGPDADQLRVPDLATIAEEPLHRLTVKVRQLKALGLQPAAEMREQMKLLDRAVGRVSLALEHDAELLRQRRERPTNPNWPRINHHNPPVD
jgi:hypothetical protein